MRKIIFIIGLLLIGFSAQAQKKKKNAKVSLDVDGVCMMCKGRIEKAALNSKGVKYAQWNVKTHELKLIIDERKTDVKTIQQNLANVGGLNDYDAVLLRDEMNLFTEWLVEKHLQLELNENQKKDLDKLFRLLIDNAEQQPKVFVHRDFHSRNLMVTKENNPGIIDYQDAVYGPISYDLVSILKDCYIKWSKEEINKWVDFYLNKLHEEKFKLKINRDEFVRWFDLMGVQRHLKASGIFARLSHRDQKHNFLKDISRTLTYIVDLKEIYKELQPICVMIEESILPKLKEGE